MYPGAEVFISLSVEEKNEILASIYNQLQDMCNQIQQPVASSSKAMSSITSLHSAVRSGNKNEIKEALIKDPNACWAIDEQGRSMLHLAVECKDYQKLRLMQTYPDMHKVQDCSDIRIVEQTGIEYVSEEAIIENVDIFLNLGLDINAKTHNGETPLWLAVQQRMNKVAEFLISKGADVKVCNNNNETLGHLIVRLDMESCCSKNIIPVDGLHMRRESEFWDWLLSKGIDVDAANADGESAYRIAFKKNLTPIALLLAQYSNDVDLTDPDGQNILHIFFHMDTESDPHVLHHTDEILQNLLDRGVSVNNVDNRGYTPLHLAAKYRKAILLFNMLKNFTNVHASDEYGNTVLHILVDTFGFQSQTVDTIRVLIAKGADIYKPNENGMSPLQLAAIHKDARIIRVFEEIDADFSITTPNDETLLHLVCRIKIELTTDTGLVDMLVSRGCEVNARNQDGFTALHLAAMTGCVTILRALLKHGASVHCKCIRKKMTALHYAASQDNETIISDLVKAGANVNERSISGKTPLHLASRRSSTLVKRLLKLGALIDVKDKLAYLPLHQALMADNVETFECLLCNGADINVLGTPEQVPLIEAVKNTSVWTRVLEHLITLDTAQLPFANLLKSYINLDNPRMKRFQLECQREIEGMKKIKIPGGTTLYHLLLVDPYRRYKYVTTKNFKVLLISPMYFESTYRIYSSLILLSYKEALERRQIHGPAKCAWFELTKIYLPDICVERILSFLSNKDLKMMIEGTQEQMDFETQVESANVTD